MDDKTAFEKWWATVIANPSNLSGPDLLKWFAERGYKAGARAMQEQAAKGIEKKYDGYAEATVIAKWVRSLKP